MARALCALAVFVVAATAVAANQCSGGGECQSSDEPQNLVLLLQTKLRMNVLEDGPSIMKNPSAMLTELEGMVLSGETPAFDLITTIKTLIQDDIMPVLQNTRDAAAQATTDALSAIQSCNNVSKTEEGNIEKNRQKAVEDARSLHAACREAEKALYDHNLTGVDSYCVKLGEFLHGADPLAIPAGSNRDESVNYVKSACLTNMCLRTKVTELDNGCTASEAELADKKAECDVNQQSFESEFCTWKTELETNCNTLDKCHSAKVTAYDSHVSKTQTLVEKWNVESAALHKILCFTNVWLSEKDDGVHGDDRSKHNATQFDVCKDQTHTPDLVDYGTPAAKVACPLTSVADHPGTSSFITQEYDNFIDFVQSVVPCTEGTTAAPTTVAPTTSLATTAAPTTIAPTTTQASRSICDVIDCGPPPDDSDVTCDIVAEQLDGPCVALDGAPVCPISKHSIFIKNSRVAIGYNTGGQHGTHQPCTSTTKFGTNFGKACLGGDLGMMDAVASSGDYFLPGAKFESWAMGYEGTGFPSTRMSDSFPSSLTTPMSLELTKGNTSAEAKYIATSSNKKLQVKMTTVLACSGTSGDFEYPVEVCLTNVGLATLPSAYWSRCVDPDQGVQFYNNWATDNEILMQDTEKGSIVRAYSSAAKTSLIYSSFAPDTKVFFDLSFDPLTQSYITAVPPVAGSKHKGDKAIGIFMNFGDLLAGETRCKTMTTSMVADNDAHIYGT